MSIDSIYSSKSFQTYFNRSAESMVLKANPPHYTILAVSDSYLELTHKKREELLNYNLFDIFPGSPIDRDERFNVESSFEQVILTKATDILPVVKYEILIPQTGKMETLFWSNRNEPVPDEAGNVAYIINTTANVTRQKIQEQEQELEAVKERLKVLKREQILYEELKVINEQLIGSNSDLNIAHHTLQLLNEHLEEQVSQRNKDLNNSEARLQSIFEQAPLGFCVLEGPEQIITYANDRMLRLWNKGSEVLGTPHTTIRNGPDSDGFLKILDEVYATGIAYSDNEIKAFTDENNEHQRGYFNFLFQPVKNEQDATTIILVIVNDVTEKVLARKESAWVNEQLSLAVEAANLGSCIIRPETMTLEYNPALARIIGYERETPMTFGDAMSQVTEEYQDKLAQGLKEAIANRTNYDFTYQQRRFSDGELLWLRALGRVTEDKDSEHPVFTAIIIDITDIKKEEERKNNFIDMISHELKTPLTSLGGYTQILQQKALETGDDFSATTLAKANRQVKRMTDLINGFLDISRLEAGQTQMHKTSFPLNELIQEVIEEVATIQFCNSITYHPCNGVHLYADRDKIGSVVTNLLSNAVKFSAISNRTIKVDCKEAADAIQISIIDKGIGIKPEKQQKIFERFYRATKDKGMSGFGIGLYLCAEIIKLHNGQIGVESKEGEGSTFWFSLPWNTAMRA